jgi:hypothetical protein
VKINIFMVRDIRGHIDFLIEKIYIAIAINYSRFMKTKDIFGRTVGFR